MNCTYQYAICSWANTPVKGQYVLPWGSSFSLFFFSSCRFSPGTHPRWNLSSCIETDPTGHRWTSLDPWGWYSISPALLSLSARVVWLYSFLSFSLFFFFSPLVLPLLPPWPTSSSQFTETKLANLQGIWLCFVISSLGSYQNLPDIWSGQYAKLENIRSILFLNSSGFAVTLTCSQKFIKVFYSVLQSSPDFSWGRVKHPPSSCCFLGISTRRVLITLMFSVVATK